MEAEQNKVVTSFGTVTDDRLIYNARKRLWAGSSVEHIPLRHITAVRLESTLHPVLGIFLIVIGLIVLLAANGGGKIFGLILIGLGGFLLWPSQRLS